MGLSSSKTHCGISPEIYFDILSGNLPCHSDIYSGMNKSGKGFGSGAPQRAPARQPKWLCRGVWALVLVGCLMKIWRPAAGRWGTEWTPFHPLVHWFRMIMFPNKKNTFHGYPIFRHVYPNKPLPGGENCRNRVSGLVHLSSFSRG